VVASLNGFGAGFTGADANDFFQRVAENLALADLQRIF